jgi:uncharacterized coiled-coil DUF342 family protein
MNDESERRALQDKFNEYKREIASLKARLNELNSKKESFYHKLQEVKNQITEIQKEKKESLTERNSFTRQIKEDKEKRNELNSKIKSKIAEKKKLLDEKQQIQEKFNIRGDPSRIKAVIDGLEMKIETEVMSLGKEKIIMKEIKKLRKQYDECKKISDVWEKIRQLDKEINEMEKEADQTHKKIQSEARAGQERHQDASIKGAEVVELDSKNQDLFKKYIECKNEFSETKKQLEEKLAEMSKIGMKLGEIREESRTETKKSQNNRLKELEEEVKRKIERGEKLTTKDLLIFQGANEEG